jgi:hypothetical protein
MIIIKCCQEQLKTLDWSSISESNYISISEDWHWNLVWEHRSRLVCKQSKSNINSSRHSPFIQFPISFFTYNKDLQIITYFYFFYYIYLQHLKLNSETLLLLIKRINSTCILNAYIVSVKIFLSGYIWLNVSQSAYVFLLIKF